MHKAINIGQLGNWQSVLGGSCIRCKAILEIGVIIVGLKVCGPLSLEWLGIRCKVIR